MLALDFFEFLGGVLDFLPFVQKENAFVIELFSRLVGGNRVLVAEEAARSDRGGHQRHGKQTQQRPPPKSWTSRGD